MLAQEPGPTPAERAFADMERRYTASENVQQAAYSNLPVNGTAAPTVAVPQIALAASGPMIYPPAAGPSEMIYPPPSEAWSMPPAEPCRTDSWTAEVDYILTQAHITRADFGSWPEDETLGLRLILGYEDPTGLGVRARLWGLSQDVRAFSDDVELEAGAFDLDLYKRFFIDDSELVLGGGAGNRGLKFTQPGNGYSRFRGGGLSLFAEGYVPLIRFSKSELGQVGRGRLALVTGDWTDTSDQLGSGAPGPENIVPGTDDDSMSVVEIAWGLEYRRRFGLDEDHSWFVALVAEHQRWESEWMGAFMGSSVTFTGLNLNTGVAW